MLIDHFKKFTGDKELDHASRYDYHLCICRTEDGQPYYAMIEYSRFGWVIEDEDMEILAYYDLELSPEEALKLMVDE
jgi:hypothetical protein